jgi:acyl-CoA thioester hydrolase
MNSPRPQESGCFSVDMDARFRDLDAMGHVNNSVYFTYFEEGRKHLFHHIMQSKGIQDFPFIIAHAGCDYRKAVQLGDPLCLKMEVSEMGEKSFTLAYRLVHRENPSVVFARGTTVQVCYDYKERRTIPIPPALKAKLAPYAAAPAVNPAENTP